MPDHTDFYVKFWGVRGSTACPGSDYLRYGGNTACLEIRCGERLLILDAGTGIRQLGAQQPRSAEILFTHGHIDHICGMPFFAPAYRPGNRFRIWSAENRAETALAALMSSPLFPVSPEMFGAEIEFKGFDPGETVEPGPGIVVATAPLNHPQEAVGYRVSHAGRSICYVTDTEHRVGESDARVLELIAGADLVIYDSTYTDEEYPDHVGWGHSTWQEGVRLCEAAGAGHLVLFHHDPSRNDAALDAIGAEARKRRPGTVVAREGMVLVPGT